MNLHIQKLDLLACTLAKQAGRKLLSGDPRSSHVLLDSGKPRSVGLNPSSVTWAKSNSDDPFLKPLAMVSLASDWAGASTFSFPMSMHRPPAWHAQAMPPGSNSPPLPRPDSCQRTGQGSSVERRLGQMQSQMRSKPTQDRVIPTTWADANQYIHERIRLTRRSHSLGATQVGSSKCFTNEKMPNAGIIQTRKQLGKTMGANPLSLALGDRQSSHQQTSRRIQHVPMKNISSGHFNHWESQGKQMKTVSDL